MPTKLGPKKNTYKYENKKKMFDVIHIVYSWVPLRRFKRRTIKSLVKLTKFHLKALHFRNIQTIKLTLYVCVVGFFLFFFLGSISLPERKAIKQINKRS